VKTKKQNGLASSARFTGGDSPHPASMSAHRKLRLSGKSARGEMKKNLIVAAVCDRRKTALTERRCIQSKLALNAVAPSIYRSRQAKQS
jgi:hypothetical protein